MTYALIDNATLTGIQRLLGIAESRTRDSIDGDIAALENLIECILFYDDIVCIDNYKSEFRESRKTQFPYINFYDLDNFYLQDIEEKARFESERLQPRIRGGEFVDTDLRDFLEELKMHIVCTWDLSSSVYYLTMKMLGQPDTPEFAKYGKMSATIFSEMSDTSETIGPNPYSKECNLLDHRGNPIDSDYVISGAMSSGGTTGGMTPALKTFVAALNWCAYKTIYYTLAARNLKADVFLYPIRQAYQMRWLQKLGVYDVDVSRAAINRLNRASTKEFELIFSTSKSYAVSLDLPFFCAWLVNRVGDVRAILDEAMRLREDRRFVLVRQKLSELRYMFDNGSTARSIGDTNKLCSDIESQISSIRSKFSISTANGTPVRTLIQIYNAAAEWVGMPKCAEVDGNMELPQFMTSFRERSGFSTLYRGIVSDLTDIPRLGNARDLLGDSIRLGSVSKLVFSRVLPDG